MQKVLRAIGVLFVTGLSFNVWANNEGSACELQLEANDRMQFVQKQLMVDSACETVSILLKHSGKLPVAAMGHNVVVSLESDMQGIAADSFKAGVANRYVSPSDKRVIAASDVIGGGESTRVSFATALLDPAQRYVFFCAAPGHWVMMKGELVMLP